MKVFKIRQWQHKPECKCIYELMPNVKLEDGQKIVQVSKRNRKRIHLFAVKRNRIENCD